MTRPPRRMLSALRRERAGREEIERLAPEQEAVRRVATRVARAAAREEFFSRASGELARLSRGGRRVHAGAAGNVVRLAVCVDGTGGAAPVQGSGLTGLNGRAKAVGGTLSMRSRHGEDRLPAELPARLGQSSAASRPGQRGLHPRQAGSA
jgi:hypothetical protein